MALVATDRARLIDRYADGPQRLKEALATVPAEALQWRPVPGEWSAHEIVVHCADSEANAALRIRYLVAERDALVIGYDQEEWARALDYHAQPLEPALLTVEAVRATTAALIRRLPETAWSAVGRHTQYAEPYTAEMWLSIYANHLEDHARQIEANVAAWNARTRP